MTSCTLKDNSLPLQKDHFASETSDSETSNAKESLYKSYFHLYENPNDRHLDKFCDLDIKDQKLEMMRVLDNYQEQIKNHSLINQDQTEKLTNEHTINMDQFKILQSSSVENIKDEWIREEKTSWPELINLYEKTKVLPLDNENWKTLNQKVRARYFDDQKRVLNFSNFTFNPTDEIPLNNLQAIVQKCLNQESCTELNLPEELMTWSKTKYLYKWFPKWIQEAPHFDEKRTWIKRLSDRIAADKEDFFNNLFHLIPKKQYDREKKELTLKIFGLSNAGLEVFRRFTSEKWSIFGLTVKIENINERNTNFFELILSDLSSRATTRFNPTLQLSLGAIIDQQALTHEFGHMLGLRDEYYTLWDEDKCQYSDIYNPANIMSDHGGKILPKHVKAIMDYYENKKDQLVGI